MTLSRRNQFSTSTFTKPHNLPQFLLSIFFLFIAIASLLIAFYLYYRYPANSRCHIVKTKPVDLQCNGLRYVCGNGTIYYKEKPTEPCPKGEQYHTVTKYPCYSGTWDVLHMIPPLREIESQIHFRTENGRNVTEEKSLRDRVMTETYQTDKTYECYENESTGVLVWGRRERRKTWAAIIILCLTSFLMIFLACMSMVMMKEQESGAQRDLRRRLLLRDEMGSHEMEMHGAMPPTQVRSAQSGVGGSSSAMYSQLHDADDASSGFETDEEELDQFTEHGTSLQGTSEQVETSPGEQTPTLHQPSSPTTVDNNLIDFEENEEPETKEEDKSPEKKEDTDVEY